LICTMHKAPQMELEAQKAGARGTLSKENSTAIVPAIHQLLNEKRAQAANSSANETPGETGRSSAHEARGESPSNHKRPTSPDPKS
jgi:DNA-binding NarL/FixJ family response regulator